VRLFVTDPANRRRYRSGLPAIAILPRHAWPKRSAESPFTHRTSILILNGSISPAAECACPYLSQSQIIALLGLSTCACPVIKVTSSCFFPLNKIRAGSRSNYTPIGHRSSLIDLTTTSGDNVPISFRVRTMHLTGDEAIDRGRMMKSASVPKSTA
jgi:hypothetical protein